MMDECQLPVQFTLGQHYPRASRHSRVPSQETGGDLVKIAVPWTLPVPITQEQLQQKREEFWETAPAYGGTVEVWQALQSAIKVGQSDMETARMILDCAGVTTPTGNLTEAYDDHGFRYSVPPYCLCNPSNGLAGPDKVEEGALTEVPVLEQDLPLTKLRIRVSTGDDVVLDLPASPKLSIGHVREALLRQIATDKRLAFFWAGHGPLPDSLRLSSLGDLSDGSKPPLQAWIFP